ncbi:LPS export ABC transporter permease LptG [Psychrobacter sp. I-STPA6b]|uniref:LPS export ABC transporter permease LptG n=1 Tax=Psychrobacter sp. I-STPA6b TaxID=2585718 RepID=UPI001D0C8A84|nr:LPS export ABC transporter permease LptG [Psychrobacter sp. I-STPA6b]
MILSRYVKKNAFFAILGAIIALWGLQIIFSYLAELEDVSDSYTYWQALQYIGYRSPQFLVQFIPTGALLGAVVGLGLLANKSELVVMRAAGVSIYRIVLWVLQPALLFVLLSLAINQFVLPQSNHLANQIQEPDTALLAKVSGYWTVQNHIDDATGEPVSSDIVFIDYADVSGNIGEVKRWHLDKDNNLTAVSKASGGQYLTEQTQTAQGADTRVLYQWQLQDVQQISLLAPQADITMENINDVPIANLQSTPQDTIALPIAPSSVYLLTRRPTSLSLTQLYDYYRYSQSQGVRSLEHELLFWQKLLSPFSILSLVIVACSFVFGSLRTHSLGLRIVVALLFGLFFSYLQDLSGFVALATGVSPLLMVILPIIASALLGLYLIKRQR